MSDSCSLGGHPISTLEYFDSDHAHDQVTRWSVSGILCFVGLTHISWTIKTQGTIKRSSYSAEFCAGQVATETAIALWYMWRSFSVPVKCATERFGDNKGMIIYFTNTWLELKKKNVAISYHKFQESAAVKIVNPLKVCKTINQANILNKGVSAGTLGILYDASYGVDWWEN